MNQPTREEFDQLKEQQKDFDKRLKEVESRQTEPIPATTRIEVASADVLNQLKALEQGQRELKEDTAVLKIQMEGARADILQIRESQADLRDRLIEHSEDLKAIKDKQDAHSEVLGQIISIGERSENTQAEHTKRFDKIDATFDKIDATMATKDDISRLETRIDRIESAQAGQGQKLDLILTLLQQRPRE